MKKQLLCTSAVALGVAAAPALSQEWDIGLGGYFTTHVGINDTSSNSPFVRAIPGVQPSADFDGVDTAMDAEFIVTPSITLDNGLTFGAVIQYETGQSGRYTDEVYIEVQSDTFGLLQIGSENSAGAQSMFGAPEVAGMPLNSPSTSAFIPFTAAGFATSGGFGFLDATLSSFTEVLGNSDVPRLTYFTPNFNGFVLGVSYAPDNGTTDGGVALDDSNNVIAAGAVPVLSDIFDIGISYDQTFGTTDVSFGARWGTGSAPSLTATGAQAGVLPVLNNVGLPVASDPETWAIAGSVTFNGFTVGGHYAENDNGAASSIGDTSGFSLGISYDIPGPWSASFTTFISEVDGKGTITAAEGAISGITPGTVFTGNHKREAYTLAANRTLGPGVDWSIWLLYEERKYEAGSPGQAALAAADVAASGTSQAEYDVDGTVLGTSLVFSF